MPKSVLKFQNNEPIELALAFPQGKIVPSNFGADEVMYTLEYPPDHITFLNLGTSQKVNRLNPRRGERIVICKRKGAERNSEVRWDVWFSPETEKRRAAEEAGIDVKPNGHPAWGGDNRSDPPADPPARPNAPLPESPSLLERQLAASLIEVERLKAAKVEAEKLKAEQEEREKAATALGGAASVPVTRLATVSHLQGCANDTAPQQPHVATRLENALKTAVAAAFAATEYAKSIGYAAMPMFTSEDLRTMANTLIIDAGKQGGRQ